MLTYYLRIPEDQQRPPDQSGHNGSPRLPRAARAALALARAAAARGLLQRRPRPGGAAERAPGELGRAGARAQRRERQALLRGPARLQFLPRARLRLGLRDGLRAGRAAAGRGALHRDERLGVHGGPGRAGHRRPGRAARLARGARRGSRPRGGARRAAGPHAALHGRVLHGRAARPRGRERRRLPAARAHPPHRRADAGRLQRVYIRSLSLRRAAAPSPKS